MAALRIPSTGVQNSPRKQSVSGFCDNNNEVDSSTARRSLNGFGCSMIIWPRPDVRYAAISRPNVEFGAKWHCVIIPKGAPRVRTSLHFPIFPSMEFQALLPAPT